MILNLEYVLKKFLLNKKIKILGSDETVKVISISVQSCEDEFVLYVEDENKDNYYVSIFLQTDFEIVE